jgi:hypothetical protein
MANNPETTITSGPWGRVLAAKDHAGREQASEFLAGLTPSDFQKVKHLCQILADTGRIGNREKFRKESGKVWALKSHQIRIGAFQIGRTWYLTHGFVKKSDLWPKQELHRAEAIAQRYGGTG